jgi:hypothetical protein
MLKGLQTHFPGAILGREKCERIAEIGVQLGRIDAMGANSDSVSAQAYELAEFGIPSYITVDNPGLIQDLPITTWGVEYQNEPDGRISPEDTRAGLRDCAIECKRAHLELYGPTVSNLIRTKLTAEGSELRGIEYIEACRPYPWAMKGSVHRYGDDDNVENAHSGFISREHEVNAMHMALDYDRAFGVSECGWASCGSLTEEEAGKNLVWEMGFWKRMKALFLIVYQIHDGPGTGNIDHFGLFRTDGTVKAAFARAFK